MESNKPGRSLEILVAFLEGSLATGDDIHIESPAKLRDRVTDKLREHDVLITMPKSHLNVSIAIECRDRSRPVSVAQVEEFSAKCIDTGVSKGVIVSSSGFRETAKKKASFYQIACIELKEIESVDWLSLPRMMILNTRLSRAEVVVVVKEIGHTQQAAGRFFTPEGEVVPQQDIIRVIWQVTGRIAAQIMAPGEAVIPFRIPLGGLRTEGLKAGEPLTVIGVKGRAYYEMWEEEGSPFRTMKYKDVDTVDDLAEIAVVQVHTAAGKEDLAFVRRSSDGMVSVKRIVDKASDTRRKEN